MVKTIAREWPEVYCKAVDLDPKSGEGSQAAASVLEAIHARDSLEIGVSAGGQVALQAGPEPVAEGRNVPIEPGGLVVVSGGARGITAEILVALARAYNPTFLVLGRSGAPTTDEPSWLNGLDSKAHIKRAVLDNEDGSLRPKELEARAKKVLANREIRDNIDRIRRAGGEVVYRSVDVRDCEAVRSAVDEARIEHGPVRGMIHGAGVIADKKVSDKSDDEFDRVYDTKVAGLRALMNAVQPDEPAFIVMFSSSTARFGRVGQIDYAMANEVLNKIAQREARNRPGCRVLSVNWGPWAGGMVNRTLQKIFKDEGIALIDPSAGADYLVRELAQPPGAPVEVVVFGGKTLAGDNDESKTDRHIELTQSFEMPLSIDRVPVLASHVIGGRAVLPAALVLEWLAHAALHVNPGLRFAGIENLRILKGVRLHDGESRSLRFMVGNPEETGEGMVVPAEMYSLGDDGGRPELHARAKVVLATRFPEEEHIVDSPELEPWESSVESVYRDKKLFHGKLLQGINAIEGCSKHGIAAFARSAQAPADWIEQPLRNSWITDPPAIDCAFQTVLVWSSHEAGAPSLPVAVSRYRQYRPVFTEDGVRIVAGVRESSVHKVVVDIALTDPGTSRVIANMSGCEFTIDKSLLDAFRRNELVRREALSK